MKRYLLILVLLVSLGCRQDTSPAGHQEKHSADKQGKQSAGHQQDPLAGQQTKASARKSGREAARQSIERGDPLLLKEYPPLPYPPGHDVYTDLLEQRCQVSWKLVRPGEVDEENFIQQVQGWNTVVEAEIRQRYGQGIMEELSREAAQIFKGQRESPGPPIP